MTKTILVIDDEPDIREVVCLMLEELGGWQADQARSGQEGLAKAGAQPWDAILLDVSMPDMDGVAVFKELQARPSTQAIPVILLTARVLKSDINRFTELGVAGIIAKPFNPLQVWRDLATMLGWPVD
jgi:CheY-like chemotaxis protein